MTPQQAYDLVAEAMPDSTTLVLTYGTCVSGGGTSHDVRFSCYAWSYSTKEPLEVATQNILSLLKNAKQT